jgi:hypothetical protein
VGKWYKREMLETTKKMYEKVENKVIFGDFESDWFDQEFRLKQGCVLSPTLFFYFNDGFSKHARK